MKTVIFFLLACLMMSGCAYCRNCTTNPDAQIKADTQKAFPSAEPEKAK